jgi:hypothetical protein
MIRKRTNEKFLPCRASNPWSLLCVIIRSRRAKPLRHRATSAHNLKWLNLICNQLNSAKCRSRSEFQFHPLIIQSARVSKLNLLRNFIHSSQ